MIRILCIVQLVHMQPQNSASHSQTASVEAAGTESGIVLNLRYQSVCEA